MKRKTKQYRNQAYNGNGAEKRNTGRLNFVTLVTIFIFIVLIVRLVKLQVIDHNYYAERARKNFENRQDIQARRGGIYDRKGRALARDIIQYSVAVRGRHVRDKRKLVSGLSDILNLSSGYIQRKIDKNPGFVYLAHRVSADKAESLDKLKDPGLILEKRFLRVYPFKENGAHFIGFCDVDNRPLGGIEYQYNRYLQGKSGWKIYQKDALGQKLLDLDYTGEDPIDGLDIMLTIDMDYQTILEDELKNAVEQNKAEEGVAVLMDPGTGELLALANYPQFDPNTPNQYALSSLKNRAVTDVFEPGSTFKIVTFSAALECLNLNLDRDIVFCENGRFNLFGQPVLDHKKYGWLTARKVFEHSSNIGTMKIAEKLERDTIYRYARNFGFGMVTGVDLPGESAGILHSLNEFTRTTNYYMSIGYEVGVTPLQLINAYSSLANGGKLLQPYMMKAVYGNDHRVIASNHTQVIRQVLSPETTELMREILVGVVEEGTGQQAMLDGLSVAGKTGTAQLYDASTGRYDRSKHLASFVGYFPAENPHFALLVMVRQPKGYYYGGLVAAPAFRNMARRIMSLAAVQSAPGGDIKQVENTGDINYIPRVEKLNAETARRILESRGFHIELVGKGDFVVKQEEIRKDDRIEEIRLYLNGASAGRDVEMPSLKGLSLKEAMDVLMTFNLNPQIEGHGVVVNQIPRAGTKIDDKRVVKLVCEPS